MKAVYVSRPDGATRLILFFAGWAMDSRPWQRLEFGGYDIAVVSDYRDSRLPLDLAAYEEIVVIAWSFGVVGAEQWLAEEGRKHPVTATIAVNGTPEAVDDRLGIPSALFEATLASLTPASLAKFYRRVAGKRLPLISDAMPQREFDTLADELRAVYASRGRRGVSWDKAIVSTADRIIPAANQIASWSATPTEIIIEADADHLPDLATLLARHLAAKTLVASRFGRAAESYDEAALAQRIIAARAAGLADEALTGDAIEIGCGSGLSTRLLFARCPSLRLRAVDLCAVDASIEGVEVEQADAELLMKRLPASSLDLVYSVSAIQWFNSLPAFLREARRVLRPGGRLVATTFGPETMRELRDSLPRQRHYPTADTIHRRLEAEDWADVMVTPDIVTLTFATVRDVAAHMRATGVNALSTSNPVGSLRHMLAHYPLAPDGSAPLTYQPIYITATKPL